MGTLVVDQGILTLVTVATIAICAGLALYVLYTVIWHAVRRGLREYHRQAEAQDPAPPRAATAHASRTSRVARRFGVRVPDYPPSDWR